jgi:hypothetical protein
MIDFQRALDASRPPAYFKAVLKGYEPTLNLDFGYTVSDLDHLKEIASPFLIWNNGQETYLKDNGDQQRYSDWLNHEFAFDPATSFLRMTGRPDVDDDGNLLFTSGMFRTLFIQKYGLFEARYRCSGGQGIFPAFWLLSQQAVWPPEIDVNEGPYNGRGDDPHSTWHSVKGKAAGAIITDKRDKFGAVRWGDTLDTRQFVTYGLDWTPNQVGICVNGQEVFRQEFQWLDDSGNRVAPAHFMLNLALGGGWPGKVTRQTFPANLDVDYLRGWGNSQSSLS